MKQVITIGPDGSMSGLQRKPGQGIDLRQFGRADIKRASLVEWDEAVQAWYIDILQSAGKGVLTIGRLQEAVDIIEPGALAARSLLDETCPGGWHTNIYDRGWGGDYDETIYFTEYDDAVKVEIAYLDALRLKGQH